VKKVENKKPINLIKPDPPPNPPKKNVRLDKKLIDIQSKILENIHRKWWEHWRKHGGKLFFPEIYGKLKGKKTKIFKIERSDNG